MFKKIGEFLKKLLGSQAGEVIGEAVEAPALHKLDDILDQSLEHFYEKNPKACALLVTSFYPFVDTVVEDLAAKTNTKYDDDAVATIKKEIEDFAASKNIALSNLDAD
jgi:hypothetical protein